METLLYLALGLAGLSILSRNAVDVLWEPLLKNLENLVGNFKHIQNKELERCFMVKSIDCSRRPGFHSQHSHGGS